MENIDKKLRELGYVHSPPDSTIAYPVWSKHVPGGWSVVVWAAQYGVWRANRDPRERTREFSDTARLIAYLMGSSCGA